MTVKQVADKVIKRIKLFPDEALQSQRDDGPKTFWDEYKEQVQYEEYDSFDVFRDTIESMVDDEVIQLSEEEFEKLNMSHFENYHSASYHEKKIEINERIISYINHKAQSEDIVYRKPVIEYIRYFVGDLIIIAKVLKQVSPEDYKIHSYSDATGASGEQGVANLSLLDEENGLERISFEEFKREKKSLYKVNSVQESDKINTQTELSSENRILSDHLSINTSQQKDLTDQDPIHAVNKETEEAREKERQRIKKAVQELIILKAKVQKKTPMEVIREMKYELEQRKLNKSQQSNQENQPGDNPTN
jgi:hypothetical protein